MDEIMTSYIGKTVMIQLLDSSFEGATQGTIKSYHDGWIILADKKGAEKAINCDFIVTVKEIAAKKK